MFLAFIPDILLSCHFSVVVVSKRVVAFDYSQQVFYVVHFLHPYALVLLSFQVQNIVVDDMTNNGESAYIDLMHHLFRPYSSSTHLIPNVDKVN